MNNDIEILKALLIDLDDLKKICTEAYSKNFYHHWNDKGLDWYIEREFNRDKLTADLTDPRIAYYFLYHHSSIVGFLKIMYCPTEDRTYGNSIELEKVYVLPESKGQGIGKFALKEIIRICKKRSVKSIFLNVLETNTKAITFYKKCGFTFHSKTILDLPYFKDELKGMDRMVKVLD